MPRNQARTNGRQKNHAGSPDSVVRPDVSDGVQRLDGIDSIIRMLAVPIQTHEL